ncbi:hypothetical protein AgCh_011712 [Apium graveolens]
MSDLEMENVPDSPLDSVVDSVTDSSQGVVATTDVVEACTGVNCAVMVGGFPIGSLQSKSKSFVGHPLKSTSSMGHVMISILQEAIGSCPYSVFEITLGFLLKDTAYDVVADNQCYAEKQAIDKVSFDLLDFQVNQVWEVSANQKHQQLHKKI